MYVCIFVYMYVCGRVICSWVGLLLAEIRQVGFVFVVVLRPSQHYLGHFGDITSNILGLLLDIEMK